MNGFCSCKWVGILRYFRRIDFSKVAKRDVAGGAYNYFYLDVGIDFFKNGCRMRYLLFDFSYGSLVEI